MVKNKNSLFLLIAVFFLGLVLLTPVTHAQVLNYQLLEKIPGSSGVSGNDLKTYIESIYNVALILVTLSAVLMLSIGGFWYLTSAGNTSRMGTAKEIIVDSLIGLVIALTAWLILNVINPDLVKTTISSLPGGSIAESGAGGAGTGGSSPATNGDCSTPNTTRACCPAGLLCQSCSDCVPVSGVGNKGCGLSTCFLNPVLLRKIQSVSGVSGWRITESWPPTANHKSTCHQTGQCADLNNSGGATDPTTIKKYYDAFKAAGLNVLYESKDCTPYLAVGVDKCGTYSSMTNGSSFHVTP